MVSGKTVPACLFPQFSVRGNVEWGLSIFWWSWGHQVESIDKNKQIVQLPLVNFMVIPLTENAFSATFLPGTIFPETFFREDFFPRNLFSGDHFSETKFPGDFFFHGTVFRGFFPNRSFFRGLFVRETFSSWDFFLFPRLSLDQKLL